MFIQVVQGTVNDPQRLNAAVQRWVDEIAPSAIGWLGSTSGVTPDGRGIAVVRFNSADEARANGERPEQQAWWTEASTCFDDVTFHDCTETYEFLDGGSDDAGFVQVIQGRVIDAPKMHEMMTANTDRMRAARPDVIGGTVALHGDGGFTEVVYFTSESAARVGEKSEGQHEIDDALANIFADASFIDLTEPMLTSPR
jgi:hypothetical protein